MREAVIANVRKQVALAKENPVVKAAVAKNELAVVGAFYEISSGQVDFLETEEELRLNRRSRHPSADYALQYRTRDDQRYGCPNRNRRVEPATRRAGTLRRTGQSPGAVAQAHDSVVQEESPGVRQAKVS